MSLDFDAKNLKADLAQIAAADWEAHFNAQYHDGGWYGVALRSVEGSAVRLYPEPVPGARYVDMPALAKLPSIRRALGRFACPLQSVRLLRLGPGAHILEHRDYGLGFDEGTIRLHVPLQTAADVEFYVDGERVTMGEGECWYLDLGLPHRVQNHGAQERIHLVLDCTVNDWLLSIFPDERQSRAQRQTPAALASAAASSQRQLENFQAAVLADAALQAMLRQERDPQRFVALVIEIGEARGYRFTASDVAAAMQANRRAWIERMIVR
ncbi:MAG TPA: aspartyl/asparaginyl beta-hydroxylase domain-containing protein [Stellaceae bacterium]|nr:aspartyl/asparaginyl beta-hydroxylase domain-containing protein [Stellaceae bacterium]